MKRAILFTAAVLLCVVSFAARDFSKTILMGDMFYDDGWSGYHIFTDKYVYITYKFKEFNSDLGVRRHKYYLSQNPTKKFDNAQWRKNRSSGRYLVMNINYDILNPRATCMKILSRGNDRIVMCDAVSRDTVIFKKIGDEIYDTLKLRFAYEELSARNTPVCEKRYFASFPSVGYDFERTFRKAFFPGGQQQKGWATDMSQVAERHLTAFSQLRSITPQMYSEKLVGLTSGMTLTDDTLSRRWNGIVLDALGQDEASMLASLKKQSVLGQKRFWEFLCYTLPTGRQKEFDAICRSMSSKDAAMSGIIEGCRKNFLNPYEALKPQ